MVIKGMETMVMDVHYMDLMVRAMTRVTTTQENESKILKMTWQMEGHKKEIEHLKHQVEYYKDARYGIGDFMEYALEIHDDLTFIQKAFYKDVLDL